MSRNEGRAHIWWDHRHIMYSVYYHNIRLMHTLYIAYAVMIWSNYVLMWELFNSGHNGHPKLAVPPDVAHIKDAARLFAGREYR